MPELEQNSAVKEPDRRSMSSLLDLRKYEENEAGHPGYKENIAYILQQLRALRKSQYHAPDDPFTILEVGPGPGTMLTQRLGREFADNGHRVIVGEYDPEAVKIIQERQRQGDLSKRLQVLPAGDINLYMESQIGQGREGTLDAIVSNFAMHHLSPDELRQFFHHADKLLKPGGRIFTGEEFLDPAQDANASGATRAAIQVVYHGERVIEPTWNEGKIVLPGLEFQALVSGLKTTAAFFSDDHYNPGGGNNQKAVERLAGVISAMENRKTFPKWREYGNGTPASLARARVLAALKQLKQALEISPVAGLTPDAITLNPQTGKPENIPGIDRKLTARQFAEIAAECGFSARVTFTGAHEGQDAVYNDILAGKRNPLGGVAVVTSGRKIER